MNFGYIKSKLSGKESIFNSQIKVPNKFEYNIPEVLDQGDKPICTACSTHVFLKWNYNKDFNLYKIFENSSPTQEGTQIKNVLEYLKREKLIDNYGLVKSDIGSSVDADGTRHTSRKDKSKSLNDIISGKHKPSSYHEGIARDFNIESLWVKKDFYEKS